MSAEQPSAEAILRAAVKAAASATISALEGTRASLGGNIVVGGAMHAAEAAAALELRALVPDRELRATIAAGIARQAGTVAARVIGRAQQRHAAQRKAAPR